ncbi:LuxR C-terminal-related transcriptional regulator [Streptomyces sp. NPDC058701]|uniref:LuxR C-terminal-related transcriptional regulator n=1 Tax=Streptomyces sp. NPDC058701 TaxID=3346608 RepID=UPI00364F017D
MKAVRLTRREGQVVQELAEGGSLRSAAEKLGITLSTAKSYCNDAARKLGCSAVHPVLVAAAYDAQVLEIPDSEGTEVVLTDGERELLPLLIAGLSTVQMARKTYRHINGVRHDLRGLIVALGGETPAQAVTRAYQLGLAGPRRQTPAEPAQTV